MYQKISNQNEQDTRFPGFKREYKRDFFKYPTILESYWYSLSGVEQKCLDFILRQTLGFQRTTDKISISQFVTGIGSRNKGSGVSKAQVPRVLVSLEEKGFISVKRSKYRTNEISLVLESDVEQEPEVVNIVTERLIEMFRAVAQHRTDDYKKDMRQVKAVEKLVEHHGVETVEKVITLVQITNGQKYAPVIGSPVDLEQKWSKLVSFVQRSGNENRSKVNL